MMFAMKVCGRLAEPPFKLCGRGQECNRAEHVATVSEFLTVGSSQTRIPCSVPPPLPASSRFCREEPAVRKALTAATSYPAFRRPVGAEPHFKLCGFSDDAEGARLGVDVCYKPNQDQAPTVVVDDAWTLRLSAKSPRLSPSLWGVGFAFAGDCNGCMARGGGGNYGALPKYASGMVRFTQQRSIGTRRTGSVGRNSN